MSIAYDHHSPAAREAFELLKAGTKEEYRVWGDTKTAARDRAAEKAGVTPAQAERLWKNWQTMKFPNGDVYRLLRNKYGHLCSWIENAADAVEAKRQEIEEANAVNKSSASPGAGDGDARL
jgi:hypothetical protein